MVSKNFQVHQQNLPLTEDPDEDDSVTKGR